MNLFSRSRESDCCTKCRPKYLFSKSWRCVFHRKCHVNGTGHRSFLEINRTRSTSTLGGRTSCGLRQSPFTAYRDVPLNTEVLISSKSTQTVCDGNGRKMHIPLFTSLSEQDYCLNLIDGCTMCPPEASQLPLYEVLVYHFPLFWKKKKEINHQFIFYLY